MNHLSNSPVRIFLFKREFTPAFELRRAIGRSFRRSLLNVLDANDDGLRTACAVVRSTPRRPTLVLVEQARRDDRSIGNLARIREFLELRALPLLVLGHDDEDPHAALRAYDDGADGYVALAAHGEDLASLASAVAETWEHLQLVKSA